MTTTDALREYVQIEKMQEGSEKAQLSDLLDKVDEEMVEYVFNVLHADTDSFISDKVCKELQDMTTVMLCLRQHLAAENIEAIMDDYNTMKDFQPEFSPTEALGMPVEEAEKLLQKVRRNTLLKFEKSLKLFESKIEESILQQNPLLADPSMAKTRESMVKDKRRSEYYRLLKAIVCGEAITTAWKFNPVVKPEDLQTIEETNEADKLKQLVTQEVAEAAQKQLEVKLTEQKSGMPLQGDQEKTFDALFAKTHYWSIIKEELRKKSGTGEPAVADKPSGDSGNASIGWSPLGRRKRGHGEAFPNNETTVVKEIKHIHKDASVGQPVSSECYVLQLPTQEEHPDGSLGNFICAVGAEGGVAELDLADSPALAQHIHEVANACNEGETVVLNLENVKVQSYKNKGRVKKIVHDDSESRVEVKGKQQFTGLAVEDTFQTPLTKLPESLWQTVIVQGSFCNVQTKAKAKASGKVFMNFALVDKHGNYVPCIAMGEEAVQHVEDATSTPNGVVLVCFAVAKPARHNPMYPNENGKLWIFKNTLIIDLGPSSKPASATREVQIRPTK